VLCGGIAYYIFTSWKQAGNEEKVAKKSPEKVSEMRAMTTIEDGENEGTLYELKSSA
jgi:hypothetical protein